MSDLNLSCLEEGTTFRSDELYFIRLAGGYIRSIFWHVFSGHNKKNREDLYETVTALKVPSENAEGHRMFCASIIPDDTNHLRSGETDCLSGTFKAVLQKLPEKFDEIFEDKLKQDFGIFLRFRDDKGNKNTLTFLKAIEVLQKRRNYLEHYLTLEKGKFKTREKYNKQRVEGEDPVYSDLWFVESLGLFLLPQILHSFAGRVASGEVKRQGTPTMAAAIHEQVRVIIKERKQNTRNSFAEENTRKKIKDKSARKKKLDPALPWRIAYRQMSLAPTDYREHEFKLRYYFIGKDRIEVLRNIFRKDTDTRPVHFRRDIEPFYSLTVNVGLLIHRLFEEIKEWDESLLKDDEDLRLIRDTIAHGDFFWDAKQKTEKNSEPLGLRTVFETIGRAAWKTRGIGRTEELFGQIENLLRHENFSVVDISGQPPKYLHITKWTRKHRKEYLETEQDGVLLDKRKDLRKEVARWMRALIAARKMIRQEVYLEKQAKK
jgi:hypothetical protein